MNNSNFVLPFTKMQEFPQKQATKEGLNLPARSSLFLSQPGETSTGPRSRRASSFAVSSPRARSICTCSNHPGSTRCSLHGYLVPRERSKSGNKEIVRRALAPSNRRFSLRWWNFQPRPSRLCNMSMA
ncbi:uncharacterized protein LOC123229016 [Mangifera indica]|uniref:uncharacterized protein LOC123229016 n=1 Tax=Mangifera indica TaxID=29780 RepID=UPI001CFC3912|nr:uncharacterized protein LOC123229016 [Mangifera indica]